MSKTTSTKLSPTEVFAADTAPNNTEAAKQTTPAETACREALRVLVEQRGLDVLGVELGPESTVADYFVVASGTSPRHVRGMADKVREAFTAIGERPISETGFERCDWIVIDYGDVVIHIFYDPVRHYYRLEELLGSYPRVELSGELAREAERLRTGLIA